MVVRDLAPLVAFDAPRVSHFHPHQRLENGQTDSSSLVNDSQVVCFWTHNVSSGTSRLPVLPPVPTS